MRKNDDQRKFEMEWRNVEKTIREHKRAMNKLHPPRRRVRYADVRSHTNLHAMKRCRVRSQKGNTEEIYVPSANYRTYNWWDCGPLEIRIEGPKYFTQSEWLSSHPARSPKNAARTACGSDPETQTDRSEVTSHNDRALLVSLDGLVHAASTFHVEGEKRKPKRRRKKCSVRYPWRLYIPKGTVDPISLAPLDELRYPPFALAIFPPFLPVGGWPHVGTNDRKALDATKRDEQKRARLFLREEEFRHREHAGANSVGNEVGCQYHLFDGRALADFLISTGQFFNPITRRILTRDEIVGLDSYLERHGLERIRRGTVTDAYDRVVNGV